MQNGYKVAQIGIDADIILKCSFQMYYIPFVHLRCESFNRHVFVKEFEELREALFVVINSSFAQISLPAIVKIFVATILKSDVV